MEVARRKDMARKAQAQLTPMQQRMKAAVEAGEISPEAARARMQAMRQQNERVNKNAPADLEVMERRIRAGVEAGRISAADARARLQAMRRQLAAEGQRAAEREVVREKKSFTPEAIARAEARLEAMVAEGAISKADARTRLNEMRRMIRRPER